MNVLILTPDRVGSTLLQRLTTIYMQINTFNRPVINLHELTNGLIKYYSPVFNAEVLGKPNDKPWGYFQSLEEITTLLDSVQHYKTSRLAHYHIKNRRDSMSQQVPFYQYLNDNFFIIAAKRKNLFEHALSWGIFTHSKRLNVYNREEKIDVFADIYKNKITIDPDTLIKYLNQYVEYLSWVDDHFNTSAYFVYERDLPNIERFILDLPIFNNSTRKTWEDAFSIGFRDWNQCRYLISDLSGLSNQLPDSSKKLQIEYHSNVEKTYQLNPAQGPDIGNNLSLYDQQFLLDNSEKYLKANSAIQELVENKVLVTHVPIKLPRID